MREPTKIEFHHRRISQISDFTELIEMLFPGNHNQQHAAACIFFELKWAKHIVPNLAHIQKRHDISRRILQRTRARLSRLGLIEHVSYLNSRYGGQHGWKLSTRFERSLNQLGLKCADCRNTAIGSREKESLLLDFADARRKILPLASHIFLGKNRMEVKLSEKERDYFIDYHCGDVRFGNDLCSQNQHHRAKAF